MTPTNRTGTVVWGDLQTPVLDGARAFYGDLFGWSFVGGDDTNTGFPTTAVRDGKKIAGMAKLGPDSPFPPTWIVYLATNDVEVTASAVAAEGGKVVVPPTAVSDLGKMAYFDDPTGAAFGVWQAGTHRGAERVAEDGATVWHEVYTRDVTKVCAFYTRVFGLTSKRLETPPGIDYFRICEGEKTAFGAMQMPASMPKEMIPRWNTYFQVADVDASVAKVRALGGSVISPGFDTPQGRIAFVMDPFGAPFCVIEPRTLP